MPHRRSGRRAEFNPLSPAVCAELLGYAKAPRWLVARAARAQSGPARDALIDPRRFLSRRTKAKGCAAKLPR